MQLIHHPAASRGHTNQGWLQSCHTFSFAGYYNPARMHFGVLRVLNDDTVAPGRGFGTHPHDNMEIISIPLSGDLQHRDNMGNAAIIRQGDIQIMSAGTGITHSEMNANPDKAVQFLQIWVFPEQQNVQPRYGQLTLDTARMHNNLLQVLSPNPDDDGLWMHQQAWFHMGTFDAGFATTYQLRRPGNGVYAFVLEGQLTIAGTPMNSRDGLGITETQTCTIEAHANARLLLMEVPLQIP